MQFRWDPPRPSYSNMSDICCKIASFPALHLNLSNHLAIMVQLDKHISVFWNVPMGGSFSSPTFDPDLQGSTSGRPEIVRLA